MAVAAPIARPLDPTSLCGEASHPATSRNTAVHVAPAMQQAAEARRRKALAKARPRDAASWCHSGRHCRLALQAAAAACKAHAPRLGIGGSKGGPARLHSRHSGHSRQQRERLSVRGNYQLLLACILPQQAPLHG